MKLTNHQTRIIAALGELNTAHKCRWWTRTSIGRVVDAGGFHAKIQIRSMEALRALGLVQTERESWPKTTQDHVRCNCGCYHWGLTDKGCELAATLAIRWSDEARQNIQWCGYEAHFREDVPDVEQSRWKRYRGDDDEDDQDDGDFPISPEPKPSPALV